MKFLRTVEDVWHYELQKNEAELLGYLLESFPFSELKPAKISNAQTPQTAEREALLNESLNDHRSELKRLAAGIFSRISKAKRGYTLVLDAATREILIQILNDIRVGAWHALGEPECLDQPEDVPMPTQRQWHLMNLAGYFENALVESAF